MRDEYFIRPNETRPDWPRREDFPKGKVGQDAFDKAVTAQHLAVRYYGHPYDDTLDWREMVHEVQADLTTQVVGPDGNLAHTYPWVDPAQLNLVHEGKGVIVRPRLRYGEWNTSFTSRYVYVSWDVQEIA